MEQSIAEKDEAILERLAEKVADKLACRLTLKMAARRPAKVRLMDLPTTAKYLGRKQSDLRRLVKLRAIPVVLVSGKEMFDRAVLDELVNVWGE